MKASPRWNLRLESIPGCLFLVLLHAVLQYALSGHDVVSVIFSGGGTAPRWMLSTAVVFAVVRILVFTWVPAVLAYRLALALLARCPPRVCRPAHSPPSSGPATG